MLNIRIIYVKDFSKFLKHNIMILVNDMKKLNRKGFTLVELIAVITILGIVATISGITITSNLKKAKDKQYSLLMGNIKNAVTSYYNECKYGGQSDMVCPANSDGVEYTIKASVLIDNGFITPNKDNMLLNPSTETTKICTIKYKYDTASADIKIIAVNDVEDLSTSC